MQEENKMTVLCQIIKQIIDGDHLTGEDEAEIKKMLDKKEQIREKAGRQCLVEIVEEEFMKLLEKRAAEGNASKSSEKLCRSVIDEYFFGGGDGNREQAGMGTIRK